MMQTGFGIAGLLKGKGFDFSALKEVTVKPEKREEVQEVTGNVSDALVIEFPYEGIPPFVVNTTLATKIPLVRGTSGKWKCPNNTCFTECESRNQNNNTDRNMLLSFCERCAIRKGGF